MRWIAKLLGLIALLIGLATVGLMAAARLSGMAVAQPLGQLWFELDPGSLNLLQALVERGLWPPLWDWLAFPVLRQSAPAVAVVALVAGVVLLVLGRRRADSGLNRRRRVFHK